MVVLISTIEASADARTAATSIPPSASTLEPIDVATAVGVGVLDEAAASCEALAANQPAAPPVAAEVPTTKATTAPSPRRRRDGRRGAGGGHELTWSSGSTGRFSRAGISGVTGVSSMAAS